MTAEENKATFLRFVRELNAGHYGIIDEVCSPNFTFYSPSRPDWPRGAIFEQTKQRYPSGPDCVAERAEFELSGDLANGQQACKSAKKFKQGLLQEVSSMLPAGIQ